MFSSLYCRFLSIVCILRRCWKWFSLAHRSSSHIKNTFIACKKFCARNWRYFSLTVYFQIFFSVRIITVHYPLTCPTSKKLIAWLQISWMRPQSYVYYSVIKNTLWTTHRIFLHCHPNKRQTFSHSCTGVKKWCQNVCSRLVWTVVSIRTIPVIVSALMTPDANLEIM
jgi:hypothetical protein